MARMLRTMVSRLGGRKEKPARIQLRLQMLEQVHQFLAAWPALRRWRGCALAGVASAALQPFIAQQQHRLAQLSEENSAVGMVITASHSDNLVIVQARPLAAEQHARSCSPPPRPAAAAAPRPRGSGFRAPRRGPRAVVANTS